MVYASSSLSLGEVHAAVEKIRNIALLDGAEAHRLEDDLWQQVLKEISKTTYSVSALAKEALRTTRIKFDRYYV